MKILAISGSLKSSSSNTSIVKNLSGLAPDECEIEIYENLNLLPHFNPEIDVEPAPEAVSDLRKRINDADAIFICTPEYAFGVPGVLKNALDWTVSSGELVEKPVAAISASPSFLGGDKAQASLTLTLSALSAKIPDEANFCIPAIVKKINADGIITDEETCLKLKAALNALRSLVTPETNR